MNFPNKTFYFPLKRKHLLGQKGIQFFSWCSLDLLRYSASSLPGLTVQWIHSSTCLGWSAEHGRPPCWASITTWRYLSLVPAFVSSPHVTEHFDHSPHSDHLQLTKSWKWEWHNPKFFKFLQVIWLSYRKSDTANLDMALYHNPSFFSSPLHMVCHFQLEMGLYSPFR